MMSFSLAVLLKGQTSVHVRNTDHGKATRRCNIEPPELVQVAMSQLLHEPCLLAIGHLIKYNVIVHTPKYC